MIYGSAYDLIHRLDRLPGILDPTVGRWRAWPAVRMQLLWTLLYQAAGVSSSSLDRIIRRSGRLRAALRPIPMPAGGGPGRVVFLAAARTYRDPDGCMRETNFGDLVSGKTVRLPTVLVHYPWPGGGANRSLVPDALDATRPLLMADAIALLLHLDPDIRRAADTLALRIAAVSDAIPVRRLRRMCRLALAVFEARRRVFRRLFARLGARAIVTTYAPGRMGEIAAARELGLPVLEVQHGMIGRYCSDYHWPAEYSDTRDGLPLADRIVAFGPLFADFLTSSGFWKKDQVTVTGCGAIDRFRAAAAPNVRPAEQGVRMLFMTQIGGRAFAVPLLRRFIASAGAEARDLRLDIKVHPEEQGRAGDYWDLAATAPWVRVLPADRTPFEAMNRSDMVISYASLSLVEALGLGIPAVSLHDGARPGFGQEFGVENEIADAVVHVGDAADLLALARRLADPAAAAAWRARARAAGEQFFAGGFVDKTASLIDALTERAS